MTRESRDIMELLGKLISAMEIRESWGIQYRFEKVRKFCSFLVLSKLKLFVALD